MYIYRIEVTKQNNGDKTYAPQVSVPVNKWWERIFGIKQTWLNIISTGLQRDTIIESSTTKQSFSSEDSAMEVIEWHRAYVKERYNKQVESITYKEV